MKNLIRYIKLWLFMSKNAFLTVLLDKFGFSIFLTGKIIRFAMYFGFLYFLVRGTNTLAGYNVNQTVFFFLTFNVVDVLSQFLFRGVYRFRSLVVSGGFDLVLVKPVNALFRSLVGEADVIDFVTIPPLFVTVWYVGSQLSPSSLDIVFYILLLINALLIAAAFHILVLALGILTLEIDHTIMIYRDLVSLGRFPVDIYKEPLRSILTFLIPVGIMISLPAKSLIGLITPSGIIISFVLAASFMFVSLKFWNLAIKSYTSASS